ncbi:hypothetical protein EON65_33900 [archaeon]|nr:MAG: hypothetical protein EON65_33900 [archaeon]
MNPQKHQGHGICGSRNIYSSKVRIDNWVEDNIAVDLLSHERGPKLSYTTVTKTEHIAPSDMPEPPPQPAKMPSTHELKTKNKEGLAYELLFEHGTALTTQSSQDRFQTVTGLTIMSRPDLPGSLSPSRGLLKSKSRAMLADINQVTHIPYTYTIRYTYNYAHTIHTIHVETLCSSYPLPSPPPSPCTCLRSTGSPPRTSSSTLGRTDGPPRQCCGGQTSPTSTADPLSRTSSEGGGKCTFHVHWACWDDVFTYMYMD